MTAADVLVKILLAEGVEQCFCYPNSDIIDPMARAGLRVITTRQERVTGNMADGVSRSTNGGQIGVFAVQALAGSENAFAGVAHSHTDSTPVLFLPGHPGTECIGNIPTFDSLDNYGATTKMAQKVLSAEQMPSKLRQAFTALRSGRPQPVMLELPTDVCSAPFKAELAYTPVKRMRSAADSGAVQEAAERLVAAETPLIWAGHGVLYAEASDELREVAELLGAPVMTTLQGKSAFPERHELAAGVGAYVWTAMAAHYINACDVLLAVGSSLSRAPFTPVVPEGKTIIHATVDPRDIHKEYAADVGIIADAKLFLAQLAEALRSLVGPRQRELGAKNARILANLRRDWLAEYEPQFSDDSVPINGYRMFRELWSVIDPDTTMLTHESGASRDIQSIFYESTVPRSYIAWGQSSQLGFSLGLAMGAKLANPDKLVVNVMGDGAVGMTGMDWETASRNEIPILSVVKHDSIFSAYDRNIPEAVKRYKVSSQYGDYAAVAAALGCWSEKVTQPAELRPALERAIRATHEGQPAVVDVITAETRLLSRPS
jgi:thiamine pyrophosphate-dependent acetolactate synthase large subunit-like protein